MKAIIVYEFLPHYRFDVFKELEQYPGLDVEFVSGPSSTDGTIVSIPFTHLRKVHVVKNSRVRKFLWQRGLLMTLLRSRPDVVVFQGDSRYLSTWLSASAMRVLGVGVLYWTIGWHRPESGIRRVYRLAFYRLAHGLLLYGNVAKRFGTAMGYPSDRMTVIYNSSSQPVDDRAPISKDLERFEARLPSRGEKVATAVLRLNPVKRLDMLIMAAHVVRCRGCEISVLLVGDGPERANLEALAASLEVPLYLPGAAYTTAQLELIYNRTTVTVIPSYAGLTTLQSFKFGVPVITHGRESEQVPESEIIEAGVTGDFYEYGSIESLANSISNWVEHQENAAVDTAANCRAALESHWSAKPQSAAIAQAIGRFSVV